MCKLHASMSLHEIMQVVEEGAPGNPRIRRFLGRLEAIRGAKER